MTYQPGQFATVNVEFTNVAWVVTTSAFWLMSCTVLPDTEFTTAA